MESFKVAEVSGITFFIKLVFLINCDHLVHPPEFLLQVTVELRERYFGPSYELLSHEKVSLYSCIEPWRFFQIIIMCELTCLPKLMGASNVHIIEHQIFKCSLF